jgi:hypothetical protein
MIDIKKYAICRSILSLHDSNDLTENISNSLLQQSVTCMQELSSESVKYNDNLGNVTIGGRIISKWTLIEMGCERID